jgi:sulfur carrier protein
VISVNGRPSTATPGDTLAALLADLELPDRGVAVAVDAEVIPRGRWSSYVVEDGAHVEVVTAVQGG